jgi:1-acyl-sn-glycerol-3-phosphate acyltransferase
MRFLRSVLFFIFMLALTPPYALFCLAVFPFMNANTRYRVVSGWNHAVIWAGWVLCGMRYRYIGREHFKEVGNDPVVLLSKHQSAWETIALLAHAPRPLCFVFKRELLWVPFFGWTLGMLKMVHINRKEGIRAFASVVKQGKQRMSEGAWMLMFPEGTRTAPGTQGEYKGGGTRIAMAAGAWIIPIAHNAGHCWPKNSFLKYPGEITVSIGPPISTQGKTADQLNKEVETWIETEMRRIDPNSYL